MTSPRPKYGLRITPDGSSLRACLRSGDGDWINRNMPPGVHVLVTNETPAYAVLGPQARRRNPP